MILSKSWLPPRINWEDYCACRVYRPCPKVLPNFVAHWGLRSDPLLSHRHTADSTNAGVRNHKRPVTRTCSDDCTACHGSDAVHGTQLRSDGACLWPASQQSPDIDTGFVCVSRRAAGLWLFILIGITLLVATIGPGMAALLNGP